LLAEIPGMAWLASPPLSSANQPSLLQQFIIVELPPKYALFSDLTLSKEFLSKMEKLKVQQNSYLKRSNLKKDFPGLYINLRNDVKYFAGFMVLLLTILLILWSSKKFKNI
jgi:hypothetical protein